MKIQRVVLNNFRNISGADINLGPGVNVLYGENAQGKTNFLESVYVCATGRSHRFGRDRDLVCIWEKEASAKVVVEHRGSINTIQLRINREGKAMSVNGAPVTRLGDLFGRLSVVIFSPEDLALVKAGPQGRRRFLDMELCQLYPAYYHDLRMYYKVLKQRNNLLKALAKNRKLTDTLDIWDVQLADYGGKIVAARRAFVERLCKLAAVYQKEITNNKENLEIEYRNNVDESGFLEKMLVCRDLDIMRGATSVGVHKDDLEFKINGKDGRNLASQGQQRTSALALKLAQFDLVREEKGHNPILLLDDVLSEFDVGRQNYLLGAIKGLQSIITLTGAESAAAGQVCAEDAKVFFVENGAFKD